MSRKMVDRNSKLFTLGLSSSTLKKLRGFINTLEIPDDSSVEVYTDLDGDPDGLWFKYRTLETDDECEARLTAEWWKQKRVQDDELAMYRILKKKFEGERL